MVIISLNAYRRSHQTQTTADMSRLVRDWSFFKLNNELLDKQKDGGDDVTNNTIVGCL